MNQNIQALYTKLLHHFGIDAQGHFTNAHSFRFPTYSYIGSKYGEASRIVVVGLDIGKDETPNKIQSFEERRRAIEDKPVASHNPHIAGTYFTALYFLQDSLGWREYWESLSNIKTCQQALKSHAHKLPAQNPLAYIALTNYYKFVFAGEKNYGHNKNRKHIDKAFEAEFFLQEIEALEPEVIIFQSRDFLPPKYKNMLTVIKEKTGAQTFVGPHPSWRVKNGKNPEFLLHNIQEMS